VEALTYGGDGRHLYVVNAAADRAMISRFALDGSSEISRVVGRPGEDVFGISPDATQVVLAPASNAIVTPGRVVDLRTGRELYRFDQVAFPTLLGHNRLGGYFTDERAVAIVDLTTHKFVGPRIVVPIAGVTNASVSTAAETIVVGYQDGSLRRYNFQGKEFGDPWLRGTKYGGDGFSISRRGEVALPDGDGSIVIYRPDGTRMRRFSGDSARFSPDGNTLMVLTSDYRLELRDLRTGKARATLVSDATFAQTSMAQRGYFVMFGGSAQLYDLVANEPVGVPYASPGGVSLTLDGTHLLLGGPDGVVVWDLDPDRWEAAACRMAARELTALEWQTYFPGRAPHATCTAYDGGPSGT
jgi:WD40 repeat protein